ncbi:MAG: hypothetical protein Q8919_00595 [Bacteroidota bacterium]|nr:hypothetical protein [Bacteroidota bacterium]
MDNSTSTPISNSTSNPSSTSPNKENQNSTPKSNPSTQNIGGDQNNESKKTEVVKENKEISAN